MEARVFRAACLAAAVLLLGAGHRTANFVVQAASDQVAEQVGDAAERFRHDLAVEWLGQAMPNWTYPCPIEVKVGDNLGAGGATTFMFDRGEVFGWQMSIQGSLERVLDSVLPHEVTHTVFASHFRQPLPRWADEGACSTVEDESERQKQQRSLIHYLKNRRGIAFSQMFAMKEYPRDILPLYAQGHSLATFLIAQGGKQKYLKYVGAGLRGEQWGRATREFYGFENLGALQNGWLHWVRQGSRLPLAAAAVAAKNETDEALARAEPSELDPARRPVPETAPSEAGGTDADGPLVPVRNTAVAKSNGPSRTVADAQPTSVYDGRARRRDTLRR
ncbi:MAG TPA: hypothetical protein VND64_25975 [Pirellulales bacterium]|nr:hypothetical protein [Pirellulales bacterium]